MTDAPRPNTPHATPDEVSAYVDGLLPPAEHAAFEARLRAQASLAEQVALQRRIDASIRGLYPYEPPAVVASGRPGASRPAPWYARRLTWLSAAAAVLLALTIYTRTGSRTPHLPAADLYARLEAEGFRPQWKCDTDERFAGAVETRLGTPLVVPLATSGVEILGWVYADGYEGSPLSAQAMILLTRVQGRDVIVLMDKAADDRTVKAPAKSGLKVFRREVGPLVLYEVTPLPEPHVIAAAKVPGR